MKGFAVAALMLALVIGGIWWEVSLWSECRSDHSFWYCLRVLNR